MHRKLRRVIRSELPVVIAIFIIFGGGHLFLLLVNKLTRPPRLELLNPQNPISSSTSTSPEPEVAISSSSSSSSPQPEVVISSSTSSPSSPPKLWFFQNGTLFPSPSQVTPDLFFSPTNPSDRIVDQLLWTFEPPVNSNVTSHVHQSNVSSHRHSLKTIYLYQGLDSSWGRPIPPGRSLFLEQRCPVNLCRLTGNPQKFARADLVLFRNTFSFPSQPRPRNQLWLMYQLESPHHSSYIAVHPSPFNLTASYRHDSDIVTPYEKWVPYGHGQPMSMTMKNYAQGKTSKVAMFVSNCGAANNRLNYAKTLGRYIPVDIYGACGSFSCPRHRNKDCQSMLAKHYKFYLAFENSNCRDYITEKFFVNALQGDVLPIVMGAHPRDYLRAAPDHSFIHVEDFNGPEQLAKYLWLLDGDDKKYNEYFRWKGKGEFINTYFFCRLCAMAWYFGEEEGKGRGIQGDYEEWWRGEGVCTQKLWRDTRDIFGEGGNYTGNGTQI